MKTLLQTLCVVLVSIGIAVEIWYRADIGYLLITIGGLAFAVSTKLEERVKKRDMKGGDNNGKNADHPTVS